MSDIAFLSNGHGEDTIACKVIEQLKMLRPSLTVEAWPMVGDGAAYAANNVPVFGTPNALPSSGFATISPKLMLEDIRAGWISTHWRQYKMARSIRGRHRLTVAVGDIIPMVGSIVAATPFVFIGCAKSAYYKPPHTYNALEKGLLRRYCMLALPRDALTDRQLDKAGVTSRYLGNPMMDGLEGTGACFDIAGDKTVIGLLAGTRADAEQNMLDLLALVASASENLTGTEKLRYVFAAHAGLDEATILQSVASDLQLKDWQNSAPLGAETGQGVVLRLMGARDEEVLVVKGHFADVLQISSLVIGMAGTANEQAIGLGIPLITMPSKGVQGEHYVRMKQEYFGDAALTIQRNPVALAGAINYVLNDDQKRQDMAAAGRERMGGPGASKAIAEAIIEALDSTASAAGTS